MDEHITLGQPTKPWLALDLSQPLHGPAGAFDLRVTLAVPQGEFVLLTGPSGAGKTTLLRVLAGLQRPENGRLEIAGQLWCDSSRRLHMPVNQRPIGFVFQDYALFPNMTVERNLRYALGRHSDPAEAARLLSLVGLGSLAQALPARLSGGQKQRLALIRALARRPQLLLLDEPLSALDPDLRHQLQDEILRLHREFATTTIMVSHDPSEIAHLADRVIRLENGRVVHDGPNRRETGLLIEHLAGPDTEGYCEALVHGRPCRLRYPVPPGGLARGTLLRLDRVEPL